MGGGVNAYTAGLPAARQLHHHLITSSPTGTGETTQRLLMIGPLQRPTPQSKMPSVQLWGDCEEAKTSLSLLLCPSLCSSLSLL